MAKRKLTRADLEARRRMIENAERTRRLAEKAQAELDARRPATPASVTAVGTRVTPAEARREMIENAERTRRLAEKAQAELDRKQPRRD
jgi:hypothetical protein